MRTVWHSFARGAGQYLVQCPSTMRGHAPSPLEQASLSSLGYLLGVQVVSQVSQRVTIPFPRL
jgi:hypothetical protein